MAPRWIAPGALAAVALASPSAHAFGDDPGPHVGATVGLAWWDGPKLALGATLRVGGFAGGILRVELLGLSGVRAAAAGFATMGVGGEFGVSTIQAFPGGPGGHGLGLHLAAGLDPGGIGAFAQGSIPLLGRGGWFAGGLLDWNPTRSDLFAVVGRPLRVEGGYVLPSVLAGEPLPSDPLAAAWLERARGETGSIPAFRRLAQELAAAGAPGALVDRARAAARDEERHGVLALEAALAHGARGVELPIVELPVRTGTRREQLVRLAREALEDGCLNEGIAAAHAGLEADHASRAERREERARIARDETAHAELGWDVLTWALAEEPALRDELAVPASTFMAAALDGATREGVLDAARSAEAAEDVVRRARKRLARLV